MRLRRRGCWFSWSNIEELIKILEEDVPHGQLVIQHTKVSTEDQNSVDLKIREQRQWSDFHSFKTDMASTRVITDLVIERGPVVAGEPQVIIEIGRTASTWRPFGLHAFVRAYISGGSESWERGVASRIVKVFKKAHFFNARLAKWLDRLQVALLLTASWCAIYDREGRGGYVGFAATVMWIALYEVDKNVTQTMLLNDPKWLLRTVARRSQNHRLAGSGGPGGTAFVTTLIGLIATVIATLVALLAYFFPRS
ncbi:hypothetical protein [Streptomyces mirabilis]|uniref:hypothetical protein n=1 Tax=Streptomyces mirabilis TaxID=68239 RepID=UPI0036C65976